MVAKRHFVVILSLWLAFTLVACGTTGPDIQVEDVWSRPAATMGGGETGGNGAVFLILLNRGGEADRLIAAQADVAEVVELHESKMEGDVMKMQPVEGGIEVPAKGEVELKPGGYHVMLIGLKQDLNEGDRFPVTLEFEKSGSLIVEAEVRMP
jgi:copper(I)-binding protein